MLKAIVRFSLRFHGVIIALACILTGYGFYTLSQAKYDVFPEFAPLQVVIQTEALGLSPEQVEVLVTRPIENAINGVTGVESIRSGSLQGLSSVTVTFRPGSDIYLDRQLVAERLFALSGQLPGEVKAPVMTPLTSSTGVVLVIGLTSEKRSLMELRTIADWTVKPRLLSIPGVAGVTIFGEGVRQIQIQIRPDLLIRYNLSIEDVLAAARRATGIMGAGFIENSNQRIVLQTRGQSVTADQIAKTVLLHRNGVNVLLSDVARVIDAPEPPIGAGLINGQPGMVLLVLAQYGTNTLEVTHRAEQALKDLRHSLILQGIVLYPDIFRPADFIQTAVHNVESSLLIGAVLVVIVLLLFLFNLRTASISLTAIPLSLLTGVTVLEKLGFSLNTMTLGGLAISVGMVVDDAIIDVENILRRLRENRLKENPLPVFQVVLNASMEVRSAVVYATFAVAMVFIPVLTMTGVAGRIFSPLGIAYIIASLASLIVALTVTPALCLLLLSRGELKEPPLVKWLKEEYRSILLKVEQYPKAVISGVVLFTLTGLVTLPFLGGGFLPELKEGHYLVHMVAAPGTSLEESQRLGRQVTTELLKLPYISSVAQKAGRAEAKGTRGTNASEFEINLKPLEGKQADVAPSEIRHVLARFPGATFSVNTFLTERIEETISGYTAAVVVNLFGNDLTMLDSKAQEVARILGQIRGTTDVIIQSPPETPQLAIHLRKVDIERWGFDAVDVMNVIRTAYQGDIVGQIYDGNRVFNVGVMLDPKDRKTITDVGLLPLRNPDGTYVQLRQLADIYETSGRYVVLHQGARRLQTVTCNVTGHNIDSFVAEAKKEISSKVSLPHGIYIEFRGAAAAQARSRHDLLVHSVIAGACVFLLLLIVLRNIRNLLLVLINLPFALVGGALMVFVSGGLLSMGSLVGFVTVFGITLRNSIMMISHYEHLVSIEGMNWGIEAAVRGASERLAPILMTASVTTLGLLPLAIGSGAPGREIEGPMAMVILGGLVTSTALNLLILPTLALRYGRFEKNGEEPIGGLNVSQS